MLRSVVTTPGLLYTLHAAPCAGNIEVTRYDSLLRSTLSRTLNVKLSDEGWAEASLSMRELGVRSTGLLAPSAYLASAAGTLENVLTFTAPCLCGSFNSDVTSVPADSRACGYTATKRRARQTSARLGRLMLQQGSRCPAQGSGRRPRQSTSQGQSAGVLWRLAPSTAALGDRA